MKETIMKTILKKIIILVLCLLTVSCSSGKKVADSDNDYSSVERFSIDTKFGDIYYPEEHKDSLYIEELYEGHSICFYADINDTKYHLFNINLNYDSGSRVGEFTDNEGYTVAVYVESFELSFEEIEESDIEKLEKMQDDVNYILKNMNLKQ